MKTMDEINLTNKEQKIIDSAKEFSLSATEKNNIKNILISYTNAHPVSTQKPAPVAKVNYFYTKSLYFIPALAMLLLVIGLNTSSVKSPDQIASTETVDTNISAAIPEVTTFSAASLAAPSVESVSSFAEPMTESVSANARMQKSVSEDSAVMMVPVSLSVEVATSTATTTKQTGSIKKIKEQINSTYKSFVSRFFTKTKKENKKEDLKKEEKENKKKSNTEDKKVKSVLKIEDDSKSGEVEIEKEVEHGVENEDDDDDSDDKKKVISPLPPVTPPVVSSEKTYTLIQVSVHDVSTDCWSVVSGGVYDLTSWIAKHPGGQSAIKGMCGVDGTVGFLAQHNGDTKAVNTLAAYKIGVLK